LAIDISGLFSTYWEINQGKEDSHAFQATLCAVNEARQGFDRVAICCDSGRSWRQYIWPTYKANRPDRGAAYRHQIDRTIARLEAEACTVFRAPPVKMIDAEAGAEYFAEADDVIGTLCAWAVEGGHAVRIYSGDKDLLQLVGSGVEQMNYRGVIFLAQDVIDKIGVEPERIPDLLALAGDKSDNFKPYEGIGTKRAVDLIKACGSALNVFNPEHFERLHEYIGNAAATAIKAGGIEPARKCLKIATVLRDLEIDFDQLIEEPVWRPVEAKTAVNFAPAAAAAPPRPEAAEANPSIVKRPVSPAIERYQFNPFALEPNDPKQAWDLALAVCGSTLFKKFPNAEAVLMVLLEGRALGIPSVIALRNAYCVKGSIGWSARMLRGLVMKSGLCDYFDIIESTPQKAVALCKRAGRPEFRVESTLELANQRGLVQAAGMNKFGKESEGNKWNTDPLVMLVADVERRGARMGWPDVVAGLYTPDELQTGITAEGVSILDAEAA
jgi:5'-3' exonuclease